MQKNISRRVSKIPAAFSDQIHPLLQRIYAARGILSDAEVDRALSRLLPPDRLKGLPEALALLVAALQNDQSILIVGDFDADGATSSVLAVLALRAMGAQRVDYLVPDRFRYGYGLTPAIVEVAQQRAPDLLITVDNGISSVEGVAAARRLGMRVLVTDHHLPGAQLPEADAIVNPNQPGCEFPSKALAGVGVIFYVMSALRSRLRELGWFAERGFVEPRMVEFLDLVALGTVADVVPLDANNRLLVHHGLQRIRAGNCRPAIRALAEIGKRNLSQLVAADLGFAIGPRLNAAGRLDDMSHGIECLLAEQESSAKALAEELNLLNAERREIEAGMQQEAQSALQQLALNTRELPFGLCLYNASWHQGVIGILASRIKERYHRPVIAFAKADNGEIKGSARSVQGVHIRDVLDAVASRHPELISRFGGHAMAAGLSLQPEHFDAFRAAFDAEVRRWLTVEDLVGVIQSDGELAPAEIDLPLADLLRNAGPWGQGFPEPLFDGCFELLEQKLLKEKHLKMTLGLQGTNRVLDAIAFNVDLQCWPNQNAKSVRLAYRLDVNEFRGVRRAQLLVEDLQPAG
ncbi:Single-stranded DNA-specific exonuclease [gamma proteobacterium HdN1]|nr:Single-stranded DNA-specific exonuclease [gamma proteobacterium HdN1]